MAKSWVGKYTTSLPQGIATLTADVGTEVVIQVRSVADGLPLRPELRRDALRHIVEATVSQDPQLAGRTAEELLATIDASDVVPLKVYSALRVDGTVNWSIMPKSNTLQMTHNLHTSRVAQ